MEDKTTKGDDGYGRIIKYTGIFGGVQGLSLVTGIVRNKLAAILLGAGGLGLVSLFNTALSLLSNCTNLGISFSAVRNISEAYDSGDDRVIADNVKIIRTWSLLTAIVGTLLCVLLSPLLSILAFRGNLHYVFHFICLSPIVGFMAITGGEVAILKGIRCLSKVALYSLFSAVASLIISIPLYFVFGYSGIVPALVLVSFATMALIIYYSFKMFPYRVSLFSKQVLGRGAGMVKLGVSFILAGILGSGLELLIRTYVFHSDWEAVGLYSCGYTLVFSFAGLVFASVDADFFPRLSSVNHDVARSNLLVNQQMEVSSLLIAPFLICFLVFLPFLLPLFYTGEFMPVVTMAQFALFSMFAKSLTLPMAYMSLSKGDSVVYLLQETLYDASLFIFILIGYDMDGWRGAGIALSAGGVLDCLIVYLITRFRYKFRFTVKSLLPFLLQLPLFAATLAITQLAGSGWLYWLLGLVCCICSGCVSLYLLHKQTEVMRVIKEKFKKRFGR